MQQAGLGHDEENKVHALALWQGALDVVRHRQAAERRLLVLHLHVFPDLFHDLDDGVKLNVVLGLGHEGERGRIERLGGAHGVPLNARDLHQAVNGVTSEPERVLHGDLRGVLHLSRRAAEAGGEAGSGHGARRAHLAHAACFGAGDARVLLDESADRSCAEEKDPRSLDHRVRVALVEVWEAPDEARVEEVGDKVLDARRHNATRAIGGGRDNLRPAASVLFVDRDGVH
mmetsp:Transcript_13310/g.37623  ORF Transcript_13310/g.37623 Transcript_13310/m.37623 type:complete len:230 (-) Transcript_13310:105-794(-)